MMDDHEEQLRRAIGTLLQSDPLIKLLQEVRLGRMKATDPGLRAVVESWIGVYAQVLQSQSLNAELLLRLDPAPRLQVLVEAGVLSWDQPATRELGELFRSLPLTAA
ncbi:MAG: hypothetical protein GDA65_11640 [Nitrospira sp. CR1.1]|jgi:hypothetical protein|nr:hypothetical protein [Nitrospira sp. CR1.1]